MAFHLSVGGFVEGDPIPRRFSCDGENTSPSLQWSGEPKATQSFALIMDDPDAPAGTWNHWLVWDISACVHSFAEGDAGSARKFGRNDFGKPAYGGPCPPRGKGAHRYFFRLFALDVPSLGLPPEIDRSLLDEALRGHVIAEAEYMGRYERRG